MDVCYTWRSSGKSKKIDVFEFRGSARSTWKREQEKPTTRIPALTGDEPIQTFRRAALTDVI